MKTLRVLFTVFLIGFNVWYTCAQTKQQKLVATFGDYMVSWCQTNDDTYRIKIDDLVQGNKGCRVDDGIMKIFVARDKTGLLSIGSTFIDNYLNGFTHSIKDGLKYSYGIPIWQHGYTEPIAFKDKTEESLYFVSMDVDTEGAFNFSGTNLFFIRGSQITKIVDFNDENSLSKAIALYSIHEYDDAFKLFRRLAYDNPNNYDAQYYTAVMEIKKQGCNNLDGKVRDLEAAWWITRGVVGNSPNWIKERMSKLYVRFGIDEKTLPFNTSGKDFYLESLNTRQLITEGLMAHKHNGKYGFINEAGKIIIPYKYDLVYPFDKTGHAMVDKSGKIGFINKKGKEIVPIKYQSGVPKFQNGRTFVILNDKLLLIDENGQVIKEVGIGYDYLVNVFIGGNAYAHHKTTNLFYIHDINGDIKSVVKEGVIIDYINHCYYTKDVNGQRIHNESYGWNE